MSLISPRLTAILLALFVAPLHADNDNNADPQHGKEYGKDGVDAAMTEDTAEDATEGTAAQTSEPASSQPQPDNTASAESDMRTVIEDIIPSEMISEDLTVDFPIDI